jgi:hypothetical protein
LPGGFCTHRKSPQFHGALNETGYRGTKGETFDTFEIAAVELGCAVAEELSGSGAA